MSRYYLRLNGHPHADTEDLSEAITLADTVLQNGQPTTPMTLTIETADGYLLGALSTRRIRGRFHKQQWEGRKHDYAIPCGEVLFDATDAILLMEHRDLMRLQDNDDSSDAIGRNYVPWDGPCHVDITASICDFFGVADLEEITPEALQFARTRINPHPATELVVPLALTLTVQVQPGVDATNLIRTLTCSITSSTPGIVITALTLTPAT